MKKFKPVDKVVENKVTFLMDRGAEIVSEKETEIVLKRHGNIVTIDSWGRVEWNTVRK